MVVLKGILYYVNLEFFNVKFDVSLDSDAFSRPPACTSLLHGTCAEGSYNEHY